MPDAHVIGEMRKKPLLPASLAALDRTNCASGQVFGENEIMQPLILLVLLC